MSKRRLYQFLALGTCLILIAVSAALAVPTVSYLLAMPKPSSHLFDVTLRVEGLMIPRVDVSMPAWSPGVYRIGNYERNVQEFSATDGAGKAVPFEKTDKQTWRITRGGDSTLIMKYKYYAGPSAAPRDVWLNMTEFDTSHASVTGPNLFMYVVGKSPYPLEGPIRLTIETPPGWIIYSPLKKTDQPNTFTAENYDTFVDAAFEVSPECKEYTFEADHTPYHIVIHGDGNYDPDKLSADLKQIVTTEAGLFGRPPYSDYTFFLHLRPGNQGSGGLEHLNCTSISAAKYLFNSPTEYRHFLSVCAHEFFHAWNVKRIRPQILGPFDYSKEQNTRDLYVSEGMTDYYRALLLKRSGLWSRKEYLDYLASQVSILRDNPGRRLQSAEMSSWETWSRFDSPPNSTIDYYNKGELLGWLLDLELRARTQNRRSLDDVFRYLYQTYGLPKPGFEDRTGFESAVELIARQGGVADPSFKDFFDRYVRGVDEIPWNQYLNRAGLSLEEKRDKPTPYLGFTFRTADNLMTVSTVMTSTPAWEAGLNINDVLLAWNGEKIDPSLFNDRLKEMKVGDTIDFVLFRGDRLLRVPVRIGQDEKVTYTVSVRKEASPEEQKIFTTWANEKEFIIK